MICSRTRPMMRLRKMEAAQIAEAMPIVRAWLLLPCCVCGNWEFPTQGITW
jgi:hypothetical protein